MILVLGLALLGTPGNDLPPFSSIRIEPTTLWLDGPDSSGQMLILGENREFLVDLSRFPGLLLNSSDPSIVEVEPGGSVIARSGGAAEIVARMHGFEAKARVFVREVTPRRPVDFSSEVVPILTKLGCNSGACHGKSMGQNGFRLSLLGGDPDSDHESLAVEGRGRRVFPAVPRLSLMLRKPTGAVPHGGGLRLGPDSPEYRSLARWIGQGASKPGQGTLDSLGTLEIQPDRGLIGPGEARQVRVVLHRHDGRAQDVTRLSRFDSARPECAAVDEHGLVRAGNQIGEAIVIARYRREIALARYPISDRPRRTSLSRGSAHIVDRWINVRLDEYGVTPSGLCADTEFARRVALDLTGLLPDPDEVSSLETSHDPGKRVRWIDHCLDRPEFADRMAMTWSALLRNQRTLGDLSKPGTFAFHDWIRRSFLANQPFDHFVEELLTAQGEPVENPAVVWYRNFEDPQGLTEDVASLFLGIRIQCARCHRHPFDRWSQGDYQGLNAFFEKLDHKPSDDPATPRLFNNARKPTSTPRWPGGPPLDALDHSVDPRRSLVAWLKRPDNPYFARAIVNRVWKQLLGRGLVEPEDDFRVTNPPSHPELLDALASEFIKSGHDLKHLFRCIMTSQTYQRSSLPDSTDPGDPTMFARYQIRGLPAEVLLDAIDKVTGAPTHFEGLPRGFRAVQLPDEGFDTRDGFLDTFGRPRRAMACECERSTQPNLPQRLLLLNSAEIEAKVSHPEGRAARYIGDGRPASVHVRELYRVALARDPSAVELATCLEHLDRRLQEGRAREGYEDLVWTVLNTKEFQFIY